MIGLMRTADSSHAEVADCKCLELCDTCPQIVLTPRLGTVPGRYLTTLNRCGRSSMSACGLFDRTMGSCDLSISTNIHNKVRCNFPISCLSQPPMKPEQAKADANFTAYCLEGILSAALIAFIE